MKNETYLKLSILLYKMYEYLYNVVYYEFKIIIEMKNKHNHNNHLYVKNKIN